MNDSAKEFDRHWEGHQELLPARKLYAAQSFLSFSFSEGTEQKVLDVGCGDGVHLRVLEQEQPTWSLVGVDISEEALKLASTNTHAARFFQCDSNNLFFQEGEFSLVFSYGVLSYTEDPEKGLAEMVRVLEVGGLLGIWLVPRPGPLKFGLMRAVRAIARRVPLKSRNLVALVLSPLLFFFPGTTGINLANSSAKACVEVIKVNLFPRTLAFPEISEVVDWFTKLPVTIVHLDTGDGLSIWARKLDDH